MSKKIKLIITAAAIVLAISAITSFVFIYGNNKYDFENVYYATYGEWFSLPESDGATVCKKNGEKIQIEDDKFFVDSAEDYSVAFKSFLLTKKATIKINANKLGVIYVSEKVVYGTVGKSVEFPEATCFDGVNYLNVTGKLFDGDNEIDVKNGFVPEEKGEYAYVLTSQAANGAEIIKTVPVYVENSESEYADKITSFDKPFGINQISYGEGKCSYQTTIKMEDEDGALRLKAAGGDIFLNNVDKYDVAEYSALYFFVYKDSDVDMSLSVGWGNYYELENREWTPVVIDLKNLEKYLSTSYAVVRDNVTAKNINGLHLAININDYKGLLLKKDGIYFSSIKGIKKDGYISVKNRIQEKLDGGSVSLRDITVLEYQYLLLTDSQKKLVDNFDGLQNIKTDRILRENNVEKVENRIVYFNDKIGLTQISQPWSENVMGITDEKTFNGEKVLKVVVPKTSWGRENGELCFTIDKPFIYDVSKYDYVTFSVYFEHERDLVLNNDDYDKKGIGVPVTQTLYKNQWNTVKLAVGDMQSLKGSYFWIIEKDWENSFGHDTTFYVSSLDAGKAENDDVGYTVNFDKPDGVNNLFSFDNADFEYTTSVKYNGEEGSTRFFAKKDADLLGGTTDKTAQLYAFLKNLPIKSYRGRAVFRTHVYYDGNMNQSLYIIPKGYYDLSVARKTTLKKGEWVEVLFYLPEGIPLDSYGLMIMDINAGWKFDIKESVYFGKTELIRYAEGDDLPFDKDYGYSYIEAVENSSVEYSSTMKTNDENGSTGLSLSADAKPVGTNVYGALYFNFVNTENVADDMVFKTRVYCDGDKGYSLYLMKKGTNDKSSAIKYALTDGVWNELEIILTKGDSFSNYSVVVMDENWHFYKGDCVYLSAVVFDRIVEDKSIKFGTVNGADCLENVWNAQFGYSTDVKRDGEEGSTKISKSNNSNGKQLYFRMSGSSYVCYTKTTFKMYIYNDCDADLNLYIMKNNYWDIKSAVNSVILKSGEWTEIEIVVEENRSLNDYAFQIFDSASGFINDGSIYFSDMKTV